MNRFYQHPLSPAWRTAYYRVALVEPSSRSRRHVAIHDPAQIRDLRSTARPLKPRRHLPLSATFPSRTMTTSLPASLRAIHQEALSRRSWRHHWVQ